MLYPPLKEHGVGYALPDDYESMTDLTMTYVAEKTDKRPEQMALFTNDHAGTLKLTDAEWDQAMAKASPFRAYLA